jgi:hypothetical protein
MNKIIENLVEDITDTIIENFEDHCNPEFAIQDVEDFLNLEYSDILNEDSIKEIAMTCSYSAYAYLYKTGSDKAKDYDYVKKLVINIVKTII